MNSPIVACYDTILALARIVPAGAEIEINEDSESPVDCMVLDLMEDGMTPERVFDPARWLPRRTTNIKALKGE